jgi:hypothetical protein
MPFVVLISKLLPHSKQKIVQECAWNNANFLLCSAVADSTAYRPPVPHYLESCLNKAVKGKDKPYSNNAHYEQLSVKNKKEKWLESCHIKLISPSMASKHN